MPSSLHEVLIEMFRDRPVLVADLLGGPLGLPLPDFEAARLSASDLNDVAPTEYRADAVVTLDGRSGPVLAVVVEVQLGTDPRKRRSWPAYAGTLYARIGCPVVLLVVCPTQTVANWCARPIAFGVPDLVLTPVVLGPSRVPVVTDLDTARRAPEITVMSAIAHGARPDPTPVFGALLAALDVIDHDRAYLYTDLVLTALPAAARERLEVFMTVTNYRFTSDFALRHLREGEAEGKAKGEAAGKATSVLAVLDARGVEIPEDVRGRIATCTDAERLDAWIRRAATATKIHDLGDEITSEL